MIDPLSNYGGPRTNLESLDRVLADAVVPLLDNIRDGSYDQRLHDVDGLVKERAERTRLNGCGIVQREAVGTLTTSVVGPADVARQRSPSRIDVPPMQRSVVSWTVDVVGSGPALQAVLDETVFQGSVFKLRVATQGNGLGQITFLTVYDLNQMTDQAARNQRLFVREVVAQLERTMQLANEGINRFNEWLPRAITESANQRSGLLKRQQWFQDELNKPIE